MDFKEKNNKLANALSVDAKHTNIRQRELENTEKRLCPAAAQVITANDYDDSGRDFLRHEEATLMATHNKTTSPQPTIPQPFTVKTAGIIMFSCIQ